MKLKLNADGSAVVVDGKPVYVEDGTGKEIQFDAPQALAKIAQLNGEAREHRVAKETAEQALAKYAGIDDVEAARKALATVKNLGDAKLVEAGKVDEIKAELTKGFEADKLKLNGEIEKLSKALHAEKIGGSFSRSKFIADKLNIPADMVQAHFGGSFKIEEDGSVRAYGADGKPVYSKTRHGEVADFEEALEVLVDAYPHKDRILKSTQAKGGGSGPGGGGGNSGKKVITRAQFDSLDHSARAAHMKDGGTVSDT